MTGCAPLGFEKIATAGDRVRAGRFSGRHLKLFTDKTELTGPNGGPVQSITTTTTDPQEAAKIYQQLMSS